MKNLLLIFLACVSTATTSYAKSDISCTVSSENKVVAEKTVDRFGPEENIIYEKGNYMVKLILGGTLWIIVAGEKSSDQSNVYTMFSPLDKTFIYTIDPIKSLSIDCR